MIYIGIDDTDTAETRGTGALARALAWELRDQYRVIGVIRHQLLRDPRVPCTKNNSSKAILLEGNTADDTEAATVAERVHGLMLGDFVDGSDPGLCVAQAVPPEVVAFGLRAQRELVSQAEARALAARSAIYLEGLGGDEGGVIGALAAVGLTASGNAGRYIELGRCRELTGMQPVEVLLAAGIEAVETRDGQPVVEGMVDADWMRPARRGGRAVLVVEPSGGHWIPVRMD